MRKVSIANNGILQWRQWLLALAMLGCALPSLAQFTPGPFRFVRHKQQRAAVPVRTERNLLIVSAFINDSGPYNFLLDTGVATSLLTSPEIAELLRLPHGENFRVVGAGGESTGLLAYQADNVRVTLPGVVAPAMRWLVLSEDALNLSGYIGMPIHGILGSELFRSFVVDVQPDVNRLILRAPATYEPPTGRHWTALPLTLAQDKAYLTIPVCLHDSVARPLKLVLDTGAGHALSLETTADPARLAVPARCLTAELGRGLSGIVRGQLGRVDSLRLGHYRLPAVLTSFPTAHDVHSRTDVPRHGNLGYELLRHFSFIIDYPHQRLLLRPNQHFGEPFEHDMCGLDLVATGPDYRRYQVLRVLPDSPAAAAGLQAGEEVLNINFVAAGLLTLSQLNRMLHSADGRLLFMVLRRADGEIYSATMRLKRQI